MIRRVTPADAPAIADIYNHYVVNTVVSFETEPVTVEAMRRRIGSLSADYPYFVCEEEGGGDSRLLLCPRMERACSIRTYVRDHGIPVAAVPRPWGGAAADGTAHR